MDVRIILLGLLVCSCTVDIGTVHTVAHVIDGDTFVLTTGEKVRLICINAPEREEPFFVESTEYLRELVEGRQVFLQTDISLEDKYGRLLRYAYVEDVFVNAAIVEQGLARHREYPPDTAFCDRIAIAEIQAKRAQRNLWS